MGPASERKKTVRFKKVFHVMDATHPFLMAAYAEMGPLAPLGDMHLAPQILLVLSGELEMHYRSYTLLCKSGEFCLIGPWEPHRAFLRSGEVRYAVVTLDIALIGAVSPFHDTDWIHPFLLPPDKRPRLSSRSERAFLLWSARRMFALEKKAVPGFRSYQWMEIHRLLWEVQSRCPDAKKRLTDSFRRIFPAIGLARNEVTRGVPLDEAAELCGLSRSRFSFLFKQETGMSFGEFALRGRIHAAAVELTNGKSESFKQIAANYGFSDVSHFYRSFRKVFGCTPVEFLTGKNHSPHPAPEQIS